MNAVNDLKAEVGTAAACAALAVPRATFYRHQNPRSEEEKKPRPSPSRTLSPEERGEVLEELNSERFMDSAPGQVYATLLDEGVYLCSERTMYRILDENEQVRERRDQLRHPEYKKPELLATGPNQVWSWDITKLLGPVKWTYFYLYVILDIYSRYVVGWLLASKESAELARKLVQETAEKQGIEDDKLVIHSDRGPSMKSKLLAQFLADLGITKTHSRPYTPNDNPYSESQFKTLKYRPSFPARFGSQEDALSFLRYFFPWYNDEHRHSGIGFMTPKSVHYGQAEEIRNLRRAVLEEAYQRNPERFVRKVPEPPRIPEAVWINPPKESSEGELGGGQGGARGACARSLVPSIGRSSQKNSARDSVLEFSSSLLTEEVMPILITQ